MTIIVFSDKNYEQNAIQTIKSLTNKIVDSVKIVYYTIGFNSNFSYKNLTTHKIEPNPLYYRFNLYKPELFLLTMELYPDDHYLYADIDILFSKRLDLKKLKHNEAYPLASYGPVEFPCIWETIDGKVTVYTSENMSKYFGVTNRTMRYCWSCILSFNNECKDFIEEWASICNNKFLLKQTYKMFTYQDETPFNVCLWKRGATKNLGFAFLNTTDTNKLMYTEENVLNNFSYGECLDINGYDWESFTNYDDIIAYHGFKNVADMEMCVNYLLSNKKQKSIFIIDCYINNTSKIEILKKSIQSIQSLNLDILLVSHCTIPEDIVSMVDYHIYDSDNTLNEINFYSNYNYQCASYNADLYISPERKFKSHEYPIIKSIRNALSLAKSLGYDNFIFSEFDNIYTENDIIKLHRLLFSVYKKHKFVVFENDNSYETLFFVGNTQFMLEKFNEYFPMSVEEYNYKFTYTYPYKLELFFYNMLQPFLTDGHVIKETYYQFFDDNKNLSRIDAIKAVIIPSQNNDYYLTLTNLESISYKFIIKQNDTVLYENIISNITIPALLLIDKCDLDIMVYDENDSVIKTLKISYDPKLNQLYDTYGKLTLK